MTECMFNVRSNVDTISGKSIVKVSGKSSDITCPGPKTTNYSHVWVFCYGGHNSLQQQTCVIKWCNEKFRS